MADGSFPQQKSAGYDIASKPVFLLSRRDAKGNVETEVLVMSAQMHVVTDNPETNKSSGRRQVNFNVESWRAEGDSRLLGTRLVMELDTTKQKGDESDDRLRSFVVAKTSASDFPAEMNFNLAYTVSAPTLDFKSDGVLRSTASGTITAFPPPADTKFRISGKEISAAGVDIDSLLCAC